MKRYNTEKFLAFKIETEAEGATFHDIAMLKINAKEFNLPVYVKIGGVEAASDVRACLEFSCEGIIAPMVESSFGARKFITLLNKYNVNPGIKRILTIETQTSINHIDDIIHEVGNEIYGITFGRTDLSGSYFNEDVFPDSDFILDTVYETANKIKSINPNIIITMGGTVSVDTIKILMGEKYNKLTRVIDRLETRRVVLSLNDVCANSNLLDDALFYELGHMEQKKLSIDLINNDLISRYAKLKRRFK